MNLTQTAKRTHPRRGFTLIELLVVVGIIALLVSIVVVVGSRAFRAADATRLTAQLQTIEKALDAYKTDFGSFPVTSLNATTTSADDRINATGFRGARLLCKALIGACGQGTFNVGGTPTKFVFDRPDQDGKEGPGFRVPPRSGDFRDSGGKIADGSPEVAGQVYGPYLAGGAISYGKPVGGTGIQIDTADKNYDDTTVLADANGNVILYFPVLNSAPPMSNPGAFINGDAAQLPMYRATDNSTWITAANLARKLGDLRSGTQTPGNPKPTWTPDGAINASPVNAETATVVGKYLLVSAGRDGIFGANPNDVSKSEDEKEAKVDDVTNFSN